MNYCVKERRQTECLEGSERFEKTKNNRLVLKYTHKSCGITKVRFVKASEAKGRGFLEASHYQGEGEHFPALEPEKGIPWLRWRDSKRICRNSQEEP